MTELSAKIRSEVGRRLGSLRKEGYLPTVLYGEDVASMPLAVKAKDFERVLAAAGETSLVSLRLENDGKVYNVLIHDVAKDPISLAPIHADFYAVRMDKPIEAEVPIVIAGESPAVKNFGGILVHVLRELAVKALPANLPHEIPADVSRLGEIGDRLLVKDLNAGADVAVLADADEVVALVEEPRAEEEITAPAEEAVAEVKTEREVKAEEKAAEKAAEGED